VVLELDSPDLTAEYQGFRDAGASYDFASYRPHITITWEAAPREVSQIEPYQGDLVFGPQEFKPINNGRQKDHEETKLKEADTRTLAERINDCVAAAARPAIERRIAEIFEVARRLACAPRLFLGVGEFDVDFLFEPLVAREPEHEVDAVLLAPRHQEFAGETGIGAQQNADARPAFADLRDNARDLLLRAGAAVDI
jgi:hypothetical protein